MPCLEITTMIGCPLRCTFCPQDKLTVQYVGERYMSLGTFREILDKVPSHVRIDFSGMSEPFVNPYAVDMLRVALECGYHVTVYTTLYRMSRAVADHVIRLLMAFSDQVEMLCIHLPDNHGHMRGFKFRNGYVEILKDFIALIEKGTLKRTSLMTMSSGGQVHASVQDLVGVPGWIANTRAGNIDADVTVTEETPHHHGPVGCTFTPFFDHNVVLPNGDVVLCCMDYSLKHRIGNLLTQDYYDLFTSQELARLRTENMKLGDGDSICKNCTRALRYEVDTRSTQFWQTEDHLITGVDP